MILELQKQKVWIKKWKFYPQYLQLFLIVNIAKAQSWWAWNICTFKFRHEIIDGKWMHFLVLWKSCHCIPIKMSDESYASWIVCGVRHDCTKKVRKFFSVTQRRWKTPKRHLVMCGKTFNCLFTYKNLPLSYSSREQLLLNFPSPPSTPIQVPSSSLSYSVYKWREKIDLHPHQHHTFHY